jgi:hypothetical protein
MTIYIKDEEAEDIKVSELIEELKQQILLSAYVVKEKEHSIDKGLSLLGNQYKNAL